MPMIHIKIPLKSPDSAFCIFTVMGLSLQACKEVEASIEFIVREESAASIMSGTYWKSNKLNNTDNDHRNHYCNENHIKHHWNQYNDNSRNGRQNSNFGNTNNYHNNDRYQHQGAKHYYQNQRNSDISDGGGGGYNSGYHHHQYDNYQQ